MKGKGSNVESHCRFKGRGLGNISKKQFYYQSSQLVWDNSAALTKAQVHACINNLFVSVFPISNPFFSISTTIFRAI